MENNDNNSLMTFPCHFDIKVIGVHTETYSIEVIEIAKKYYPEHEHVSMRSQKSTQGNFISVTLTVYAQDQATLDALYGALTKHPHTKMVL